MQRARIYGGATAGAALVAMALSLAACSSSSSSGGATSSSSPSSGSSSSGAKLSGTLNGSGSTFQLTFQQTAIASFKSVQPSMTVNYGGGGSGKGLTDLASGTVQYAGSDAVATSALAAAFMSPVLFFPVVDATFRYFWLLLALVGALSRVRWELQRKSLDG